MDRAGLVRELLAGHAEPASAALPPGLLPPDTRARELTLDRDTARRLLTDARLPEGFTPTLTVSRAPRPYLLEPLQVAARIKDDLGRIGLTVHLREIESWAEHVAVTSRGDYELALLGWRADTLDPNDFLTALFDSGSIGTTNRSRYRSEDMDALLKQGRRGHGPAERESIYYEAQALFQRDMPFIPLYHVSVFTAYRRSLQGLVLGPTGVLRYDKAWKER